MFSWAGIFKAAFLTCRCFRPLFLASFFAEEPQKSSQEAAAKLSVSCQSGFIYMRKSKVVELIEELESEVNNGGFDQFYFNSSGDEVKLTIDALNLIGAHHTADIVVNTLSKFPNSYVPVERDIRQKILENISPNSDIFEKDDANFLEYVDDLADLANRYENS